MKGNLLIIDDENDICEMLKLQLRSHAENIYLANRGQEGLETLATHEIHCVICDISMPGMSGIEVIRHVRESGNEVPFIFFTGFGSSENMLDAARYGAFDFLEKPHFEDLEEIVARGLSQGFEKSPDASSLRSEYENLLEQLNKIMK